MKSLQLTNNETLPAQPEVVSTSISSFTAIIIGKMQSGKILTEKGKIYSDSTIRCYDSFYVHFKNFEDSHGAKFEFSEVSYDFTLEFQAYLTAQGLTKNSVSMVLSKMKAILKMAWRKNLCHWNGSGLRTPTEKTTKVYLTIDEIRKMKEAQLTNSERLVMDAFIIQIFTGLRFDTLQKFLKNPLAYIQEHDGKAYIDIVSDKTGEQSLIPLGETVRSVISKYNGCVKTFTEQHTNRVLKTIAEKAGITHAVPLRITEGGRMQERLISKYKLISTHSSRRSFITLAKKSGLENGQIMPITGHATERQMMHYVRHGKLDEISGILGHKFFDTKI